MDNAQKAIMIGVGLFITIIIISVVLLITNLGTGTANEGANAIKGVSDSLKQQMILAYNDKEVTKSDVISCYTMYKSYVDDKTLIIYIKSSPSDTATEITSASLATTNATSAKYTGKVSTASTGDANVITFTAL